MPLDDFLEDKKESYQVFDTYPEKIQEAMGLATDDRLLEIRYLNAMSRLLLSKIVSKLSVDDVRSPVRITDETFQIALRSSVKEMEILRVKLEVARLIFRKTVGIDSRGMKIFDLYLTERALYILRLDQKHAYL